MALRRCGVEKIIERGLTPLLYLLDGRCWVGGSGSFTKETETWYDGARLPLKREETHHPLLAGESEPVVMTQTLEYDGLGRITRDTQHLDPAFAEDGSDSDAAAKRCVTRGCQSKVDGRANRCSTPTDGGSGRSLSACKQGDPMCIVSPVTRQFRHISTSLMALCFVRERPPTTCSR